MKALKVMPSKQKRYNKVALVRNGEHFRVMVQKTNYREGTKWYTKLIDDRNYKGGFDNTLEGAVKVFNRISTLPITVSQNENVTR